MSDDCRLIVELHPLLHVRAFVTTFPRPLGDLPIADDLLALIADNADPPVATSDAVRKHVRDLLRHGGFKPTGRNKPASEYLLKAVAGQTLSPINRAVDTCNVVSFHSGLPISVVDLDRLDAPLRIGLAAENSEYIFNVSGQILKLDGLLCLFDNSGPCANAVKDSQRTKTSDSTRRTLSIVWGSNAVEHTEATESWYRELLMHTEPAAQVESVLFD